MSATPRPSFAARLLAALARRPVGPTPHERFTNTVVDYLAFPSGDPASDMLAMLAAYQELIPADQQYPPLSDPQSLVEDPDDNPRVPLADHPALEWLAIDLWHTVNDGHGSMELHDRLAGWLADREATGLAEVPVAEGRADR